MILLIIYDCWLSSDAFFLWFFFLYETGSNDDEEWELREIDAVYFYRHDVVLIGLHKLIKIIIIW